MKKRGTRNAERGAAEALRVRRARPRDFLAIAALDRAAWRRNRRSRYIPDGEHVWQVCEIVPCIGYGLDKADDKADDKGWLPVGPPCPANRVDHGERPACRACAARAAGA